MTPTIEQIEAEFDGFIEFPIEDKRFVSTVSAKLFAEHIAAQAHAAGREQGLQEAAAKVRAILADCEARDVDDPELEQVAQDIEQLRACGSAATPG